MGTTAKERESALAWIARQLHWERTLADLRAGGERDQESEAA